MGHDVFCGFSLPVLIAFLALVLVLLLMAPALARELATLRRPPPVRLPASLSEADDAPALHGEATW